MIVYGSSSFNKLPGYFWDGFNKMNKKCMIHSGYSMDVQKVIITKDEHKGHMKAYSLIQKKDSHCIFSNSFKHEDKFIFVLSK